MPKYDYKCIKCETIITIERSLNEVEVIPTCKQCKQLTSRLYNSPAITFKGSGFYSTDGK
jgi:putative FmdB family regulatory protein